MTTKSRRCGKGSGMIRGRRIQFGLLERVSNLTSGWEYSMEVWWCGVKGILFSVGVLEMETAIIPQFHTQSSVVSSISRVLG